MQKNLQPKTYRIGAKGALLDIYAETIRQFQETISDIPTGWLPIIIDEKTTDENCRSLQTILSHVVHAGFGYATSIYNSRGNTSERPAKKFHEDIFSYVGDLDRVFKYTEQVFAAIEDADLEQNDGRLKISTGWGQQYDIEQMMEHAITHILRHRRQIEKIIQQFKFSPV